MLKLQQDANTGVPDMWVSAERYFLIKLQTKLICIDSQKAVILYELYELLQKNQLIIHRLQNVSSNCLCTYFCLLRIAVVDLIPDDKSKVTYLISSCKILFSKTDLETFFQ